MTGEHHGTQPSPLTTATHDREENPLQRLHQHQLECSEILGSDTGNKNFKAAVSGAYANNELMNVQSVASMPPISVEIYTKQDSMGYVPLNGLAYKSHSQDSNNSKENTSSYSKKHLLPSGAAPGG